MSEQDISVLKALANGINYFTGESCAEDSILNDPNIIRALFNACDELQNRHKKPIKVGFVCPSDIEEKYVYEGDLSLSNILKKIAELYPEMSKPNFNEVSSELVMRGVLEEVGGQEGKSKIATEYAKQLGIFNVKKTSRYGKIYNVVTYNKDGQKYLLSVLKNL